jgi:hypothetical protein
MAEVAGCGGSLTFTNLTAGVKNWTVNYTCDVLETTDFADNCKRTYIAGLSSWTATATANWDAANTADPGDSATLTLTADTGKTYAGTAIMTGLSVNVAVDGVNSVTYNFQGTGTLTITLT